MAKKKSGRETAAPVLLIGYEERENLGLRYILSRLREAGFIGEILKVDRLGVSLVEQIIQRRPALIGLSMIFQYMAPEFGRFAANLRTAGVACHITIGGHFPSFDFEETLCGIPELDSVVRFEGEETLVELLRHVYSGTDWRQLPGIAYRKSDGTVVANPLRTPVQDLDLLPMPARDNFDYASEDPPTAAILGSRGCPYHCSFCSIRPFYEAQGGRLRRLRNPKLVVEEMLQLYEEHGARIFLFQDDDFLAGGRSARKWALDLADTISSSPMAGRVAYKINSRSNGIRREVVTQLRDSGMTHVYMGVEAGDASDLADMNKRLSPEDHLRAADVLRDLGVSFDFGFMLLQPYSTIERVRNNIDFLDAFVGDGWSTLSFCRMLPYAGAAIREKLATEGRLLGSSFEPDYHFLDPKLDLYYDWITRTYYKRNFTSTGLCHAFRALNFEARLRLRSNPFTDTERRFLQHLCEVSNRVTTDTLRTALDHIESATTQELGANPDPLNRLSLHQHRQDERLQRELAVLYSSVLERRRHRRVCRTAAQI